MKLPMTRYAFLGTVALLLVAVGGVVGRATQPRRDPDAARKVQAFDRFCRTTRMTLDTAIRDLETGDAQTRLRVADNMSGERVRYGSVSVEMCLGTRTPDLGAASYCRDGKGEQVLPCYLKLARAYRDELARQGF